MTANLSAGISLKPQHYEEAIACRTGGLWFEVHPENYFLDGPRLEWLEAIRAQHPVSLHGVALSLAADSEPDATHLARLADLVRRIEPVLISEHLAWSTWRGEYHPDLLPFPRTHAALARIAENISRTQDKLSRRIAIENPAHYLKIDSHEWDEIEFLDELCNLTGCGVLLDVNNVYVGARNLDYSASDYIDRFPSQHVMEIHLAGHTDNPDPNARLLIDSHNVPVSSEVWALYERLIDRIGLRPVLIERDDDIPDFHVLLAERDIAHRLLNPTEKS
jgi:uncharacterized protein (UPF0276 family)